MVQQPIEENEEAADVISREISRAENLKSLSIVISLFDHSNEKDLNLNRHIEHIHH